MADITRLPRLLHGDEKEVFGDQAYWNEFHRQCAKVEGVRYRINRRPAPGRPLSEHHKLINRVRSKARARGEHARISILKRLAWLSVVGIVLLGIAFALAPDSAHPNMPITLLGVLAVIPVVVYLVILTIWHWKGRYRGSHSDLWGALLLVETSGWFKLIYLFRHIIPDAKGTGRYTRQNA